jgi:hypothetical protein
MSQQQNIMHKTCLPPCKGGSLSSEYFPIPDNPDIPTCQHKYLHKKWLRKFLPGVTAHHLQIIISPPIKLQVIPNPDTEVTLKK